MSREVEVEVEVEVDVDCRVVGSGLACMLDGVEVWD